MPFAVVATQRAGSAGETARSTSGSGVERVSHVVPASALTSTCGIPKRAPTSALGRRRR